MNPTDILYPAFWLLPAILPLLLALALAPRALRPAARALAPLAALPALVLALFASPGTVVEVPLLLGTRLGLTTTTQVFLLFTAGLWLLAGLYARAYLGRTPSADRFFGFLLASMSGNLGLVLARDVVGFYLFFILMSFAAYGLVVHDGTRRSRRAGRVYLVLVVVGEAFLLPAMILVSVVAGTYRLEDVPPAVAESPLRGVIFALVLAGFGIKAGALPLHVWLPLAHPAAPTPASAVLSGSMIKAGLLGWLLFLPVGEAGFPGWSALCVAGGLLAAFYGVLVGLTQENPKTILAYSSISQMGWITVALGVGLLVPDRWPVVLAAILIYAASHALVKGSLFLGLGVADKAKSVRARRLSLCGLVIGALALAGAPLTSGAVAKYYLKTATDTAPGSWPAALEVLLQAGAVGTTLLMVRFLFAALPTPGTGKPSPEIWLPWAVLLVLVTFGILALPGGPLEIVGVTLSPSALWPLAVGALLAWGFLRLRRGTGLGAAPRIPEGDLVVPVGRLLGPSRRLWAAGVLAIRGRTGGPDERPGRRAVGANVLVRLETALGYWSSAGILLLALIVVVVILAGAS